MGLSGGGRLSGSPQSCGWPVVSGSRSPSVPAERTVESVAKRSTGGGGGTREGESAGSFRQMLSYVPLAIRVRLLRRN